MSVRLVVEGPTKVERPRRSAWLRLACGGVIAAMRRVESLPPLASGALLVGDRALPAGMILVERNRVCWSAAAGMGRRLRDILRDHCASPIGEVELEALYARCRNDHRPLGETLVAEGLFTPEQMRAAMKLHTAESLLALDAAFHDRGGARGDEWPMVWAERSDRGYNPRYTFTAAEVIAAVGARLLDDTTAELIADHLQRLASAGGAAVAFAAAADGTPVFVGALTTLWLLVQDLLDLAAWATAALEASPGFSPAVAHSCARRSSRGGTVAWRYEGHRCAAICPSGLSLQRLVTALDRQSLAMVLATKLAVLERVRERTAFVT